MQLYAGIIIGDMPVNNYVRPAVWQYEAMEWMKNEDG